MFIHNGFFYVYRNLHGLWLCGFFYGFFMVIVMAGLLLYLLDRLKEPSTWRGIVMIVTAAGINLSPEEAAGIASIGVGVAGVIGAVTRD